MKFILSSPPLKLIRKIRLASLLIASFVIASFVIASLLITSFWGAAVTSSVADEPLEYVQAAIDNPLKGLVPYSGDNREKFPHSMEFRYVPLGELMSGMNTFNWEPLEKLLNDVTCPPGTRPLRRGDGQEMGGTSLP